MPNGFQTWKDVLDVLVIPIALALIAYAYPQIQNTNRRQKFLSLIFRELQELKPHPKDAQPQKGWWDHQTKDFVHKRILESPSENRDFILSLPPDIIYPLFQLWSALGTHNGTQWLNFLNELANSCYDKTGEIKAAYDQWNDLICQYQKPTSPKKEI